MNKALFDEDTKSAVQEPMVTGLSICKETKEAYDVLLAIKALHGYRLRAPIVIENAAHEPVVTLDLSKGTDTIGDSHACQGSLKNNMSGKNTCAACTCDVSEFWDIEKCCLCDEKSLESARKMVLSGEMPSWLRGLPSIFLGDAETPTHERHFALSHVRFDFILHG